MSIFERSVNITQLQNDLKGRVEKFFVDVNKAHNLVLEFEQRKGKISQKELIEELEGLIRLTKHYEIEIPKKLKDINNSALEKQSVKLKHAQMLVMLDLITLDERRINQEYIKGLIDEMEEKKDKSSKSNLELFGEGEFGKDITHRFNVIKENYQRSQVKERLKSIRDSNQPGHLHFAGRKLDDDRFVDNDTERKSADNSFSDNEKKVNNYYKELREKADKKMKEYYIEANMPTSNNDYNIELNKIKCDPSLTGEAKMLGIIELVGNRLDSLGNIAVNMGEPRKTVDEYGNTINLRGQ